MKDPTLEEVKAAAFLAGLTDDDAELFFHHFNAQGWVRANGQAITNIGSQLVLWKKSGQERTAKKKKLLPLIGKNCSKQGCRMPAVYIKRGAYDHPLCLKHCPKEVQEAYS